jgi:hypothetical protein
MRARLIVGFVVLLALGCGGGKKLAPVSGVVKLNGKPLPGATVSFTPLVDTGSIEAPLSSVGKTNANGEYTLEATTGQSGALVAKHKVSITLVNEQRGDSDARPPRGGWPIKDKIPLRYNEKTELFCDVPAGGKTDANFDLKSP